MKEPGKFDLVYHNENGAEVVEYAVTQEKRVGVLLFWDCLVVHSLNWLLVVWRVTRCGFLHCLHKIREDPGLGGAGGSPEVSTVSPYSHYYLPRVTVILT